MAHKRAHGTAPDTDHPPASGIAFNKRLVGQGNAQRKEDLRREFERREGAPRPLTDREKSLEGVSVKFQYVLIGVVLPDGYTAASGGGRVPPATFDQFREDEHKVLNPCAKAVRVGVPVSPESKASKDSSLSQQNKVNAYALIDERGGLHRPTPLAADNENVFYYPEWMEGTGNMTDARKRSLSKIKPRDPLPTHPARSITAQLCKNLAMRIDTGDPIWDDTFPWYVDADGRLEDVRSHGSDVLEKVVLGMDEVTGDEARTAARLLSERSGQFSRGETELAVDPKSVLLLSRVLRRDGITPVDRHLVHSFLVNFFVELEEAANEEDEDQPSPPSPTEDDVRRAIDKARRRARMADHPPLRAFLPSRPWDGWKEQWGPAINEQPLSGLLRELPQSADINTTKSISDDICQVINQQNDLVVSQFLELLRERVADYQELCRALGAEEKGEDHDSDEDDDSTEDYDDNEGEGDDGNGLVDTDNNGAGDVNMGGMDDA
ncbi:hypothetical protein DL766_001604 [Monosporascus sp. MC13-8B]|nr:hypothetical protein DL763_006605 [Monosporascus cannonballus]RYP37294.1 hypothetical protein DL766_001604 [Monosporascus sp. MC13-8B]